MYFKLFDHMDKVAVPTDKNWFDVGLFPGEPEVKRGDVLFVVTVDYDTGDSFSHDPHQKSHQWAFSNVDTAYELADWIKKDNKESPDINYFDHRVPYEAQMKKFKGVPINTNTWKGYFEHFNYATVDVYMVKDEYV